MINYDRRFVEQLQTDASDWKKQEKNHFKKTLFWVVLLIGVALIFGI